MEIHDNKRLSHRELGELFDQLFPHGVAGPDVVSEVAPEGWERSPLIACFHPSIERVFEETLHIRRNIEALLAARNRRQNSTEPHTSRPEPTLEDVRRDYRLSPVQEYEELTELVGLCLWDIFSDNHDVVAPDGRVADIGSFRAASAFLDEYLTRDKREAWRGGDYMRFYMGTAFISARADLTPVYAMIFRKLRAIGCDWVHHFPEIHLIDISGLQADDEKAKSYSVSEGAAAEVKAQKREADLERLRADLAQSNAEAREKAMDQRPPETVRAYRSVYGRDPRGWPPAA
jgi:hypothetical protein